MSVFSASGRRESSIEKRSFAFSVVLHCSLALAIVIVGVFSAKRRNAEPKDVMMEFTVAVPPAATEAPSEAEASPPAPVEPEPPAKQPVEPPPKSAEPPPKIVEPSPTPTKPVPKIVEPPPKPAFKKGKIVHREAPEKKRNIVQKPQEKTAKQKPVAIRRVDVKGPKLSEEEIRKLLDAGAKPSDHTSIPASERERCISLIYTAIKSAWICPDASALSSREPEIEFSLGPGGTIGNVRLVRSSGNEALDQSVLGAARAVRTVSGLSPGFIRANPRLTVAFSLEGA